MSPRILAVLILGTMIMPAVAAAQSRRSSGNQEFIDAFMASERARMVDRVHREGEKFDSQRELEKLRQKHEKVFGTAIPDRMLTEFDRVARDAKSQPPDPRLLDPATGRRKSSSEVNPDLYMAGIKVKFMEDIREEGAKFETSKEIAEVAQRYERNFGTPLPSELKSDLGRIADDVQAIVIQQRGASTPSKESAAKTAPTTVVVRGIRYPAGLPEWFAAHDKDQDGQVGLYEWERDKHAEFHEWDRNGDGFLAPREVLRRQPAMNPSKTARK